MRFRIASRAEEYGDWGTELEPSGDSPGVGVTEGSSVGPIAGPSVLGCASVRSGCNNGPGGGLVNFGALSIFEIQHYTMLCKHN